MDMTPDAIAAQPMLLCLSHLRWDLVLQGPQRLQRRAAQTWRVRLRSRTSRLERVDQHLGRTSWDKGWAGLAALILGGRHAGKALQSGATEPRL